MLATSSSFVLSTENTLTLEPKSSPNSISSRLPESASNKSATPPMIDLFLNEKKEKESLVLESLDLFFVSLSKNDLR
jgi:hypothetical protein